MSEPPADDFVESVRRKADRMKKSRSAKDGLWRTLGRAAGIGWMVVLPAAIGAVLGHWLAVRLGRPGFAIAGIGLGVAVGVYAVYVQMQRLLARDAEEPAENRAVEEETRDED